MNPELKQRIQEIVDGAEVVLFMKGSRQFPQCGFSAAVVSVLDDYLEQYTTLDVLSDPDLRQGIKEFSDWPTIPQLYVKGEFVGGCDIVRDMHASGELSKTLGVRLTPVEPPTIHVTDDAAEAFKAAQAGETDYKDLRLEISAHFQYGLSFGPKLDGDIVAESAFPIRMDRATARRADGMKIDFVEEPGGATGFKIDNPNEPPKVGAMTVQELKERLDTGAIHLFDVRPEDERAQASIDGAIALDEAGTKQLAALDKQAPIAFLSKSGGRSLQAASHYLAQGHRKVFNVTGGIDAWSQHIDTSVPRY